MPAQPAASVRRRAVIDIGTVTCRLLVADVGADGTIREIARDCRIVNLGEGVDATGRFSDAAMQRTEDAIAHFAHTIGQLATPDGPIPLVAVGTSACRDAQNAQQMCDRLHAYGVELTVIEGQREAAYSFAGASRGFEGQRILVADIGGGSTELVAGVAGQGVAFAHSFDVGCRRITERFLAADPPDAAQMQQARNWYLPQFKGFFDQLARQGFAIQQLVAVAGTATSVVSVDLALDPYDSAQVHGRHVPEATLQDVMRRLATMPLQQRMQVVGLQPQRAPVIVAGLMELCDLVELACTDGFVASEADILQGAAILAFD